MPRLLQLGLLLQLHAQLVDLAVWLRLLDDGEGGGEEGLRVDGITVVQRRHTEGNGVARERSEGLHLGQVALQVRDERPIFAHIEQTTVRVCMHLQAQQIGRQEQPAHGQRRPFVDDARLVRINVASRRDVITGPDAGFRYLLLGLKLLQLRVRTHQVLDRQASLFGQLPHCLVRRRVG